MKNTLSYELYLYKYGINAVLLALDHFEKKKKYKECAKIMLALKDQERMILKEVPTRYTIESIEEEAKHNNYTFSKQRRNSEEYSNIIIYEVTGKYF